MVRALAMTAMVAMLAACGRADSPALSLPEPEILRPSQNPPPKPPPDVDELFARDHLLQVDLFIAEEDWARVQRQRLDPKRFGERDCQQEPYGEFEFHPATIAVDRTIVEAVGVRQRGFLYELNEYLPPLEIAFDAYRSDQRFRGRRHLFLDSAPYDPSGMRTCLAYWTFERAGLPAPRCSFAHVRVNGMDLGIYAHVEPIDAELVADRFSAAPASVGPIFEGRASDFREGWMATFEGPEARAPLVAVRDAVSVADNLLVDRLEAVVDLDHFHRFWAVETLIGHWDGYTGNADRFFVYAHPERGLIFLPSSPQQSFTEYNPGRRGMPPASIFAQGELARRLYLNAEGRTRHEDEIERALADVWDEPWLIEQIDRMEPMIAGRAVHGDVKLEAEVLRAFVRSRSLDYRIPAGSEWTFQQRPTFCVVPRGVMAAAFSTRWDTLPQGSEPFSKIFLTGTGTLAAVYDDVEYLPVATAGAAAGPSDQGTALLVVVVQTGSNGALLLYVVMDQAQLGPGSYLIDNESIFAQGAAYVGDLPRWTGYLYGSLEIDRAGTSPDAPVEVRVAGELY